MANFKCCLYRTEVCKYINSYTVTVWILNIPYVKFALFTHKLYLIDIRKINYFLTKQVNGLILQILLFRICIELPIRNLIESAAAIYALESFYIPVYLVYCQLNATILIPPKFIIMLCFVSFTRGP